MTPYLTTSDPSHERFDALARATVNGTIASTGAVLGGMALGGAGSPLVWLLLAASVPFAAKPIVRWRRAVRHRRALPVGHLSPAWREVVAAAAAATARIEVAHREAPAGAVADHLAALRDTAWQEVRRLHEAASMASAVDPQASAPPLDGDTRAARLLELAEAAERLRAAQRGDHRPDELDELVETTDRLTETLRSQDHPSPG